MVPHLCGCNCKGGKLRRSALPRGWLSPHGGLGLGSPDSSLVDLSWQCEYPVCPQFSRIYDIPGGKCREKQRFFYLQNLLLSPILHRGGWGPTTACGWGLGAEPLGDSWELRGGEALARPWQGWFAHPRPIPQPLARAGLTSTCVCACLDGWHPKHAQVPTVTITPCHP